MWPRILMLACLSTAQSTIAEVTSTIKGSIESTVNERPPGGVVRLDSPSLGLSREVVSDIDGFYEFRAVPPAGDYLITLDYAGFAPVEAGPVSVGPGERLFLPLVLRSAAASISVFLGGRWLVDDELQLYLSTEERIAEAFRRSDGTPTIDLIVSALQDVDDLPEVVSEEARWSLVRSVSSGLGSVEPVDPLVHLLLSDPEARIQSMAIDLMLNDGAWLMDPAMREFLQGILRSPTEGAEAVPGILLVYAYADRFAEVLPVAMDLARSPDPELSRLEPEEWFFGVTGSHRAEHSLCAVLEALRDHPELQRHLKKLGSDLVLLEPDDLADVQRALSVWVRRPSSARPPSPEPSPLAAEIQDLPGGG